MELTDDVIKALQDDPILTTLVGKRVYWVKPPGEKYTYPFLTVAEASNTPADYDDDEESEQLIEIQVEIFHTGKFTNVKNAVNTAMISEGFDRQASGPDDYIPELKLYHKTLSFSKQVPV
jgi:hypothetical protein